MESKEKELRNLPVVPSGVVAGACVVTTEKKTRKIVIAITEYVYK